MSITSICGLGQVASNPIDVGHQVLPRGTGQVPECSKPFSRDPERAWGQASRLPRVAAKRQRNSEDQPMSPADKEPLVIDDHCVELDKIRRRPAQRAAGQGDHRRQVGRGAANHARRRTRSPASTSRSRRRSTTPPGKLGIKIPILCHREHMNPVAVCRFCAVDVGGRRPGRRPVTGRSSRTWTVKTAARPSDTGPRRRQGADRAAAGRPPVAARGPQGVRRQRAANRSPRASA